MEKFKKGAEMQLIDEPASTWSVDPIVRVAKAGPEYFRTKPEPMLPREREPEGETMNEVIDLEERKGKADKSKDAKTLQDETFKSLVGHVMGLVEEVE